jgi:hypothetical protein
MKFHHLKLIFRIIILFRDIQTRYHDTEYLILRQYYDIKKSIQLSLHGIGITMVSES